MTLALLSFVSLELLQRIKGWGGEGGCLGRESSELTTLLFKDEDFRQLPILTISHC